MKFVPNQVAYAATKTRRDWNRPGQRGEPEQVRFPSASAYPLQDRFNFFYSNFVTGGKIPQQRTHMGLDKTCILRENFKTLLAMQSSDRILPGVRKYQRPILRSLETQIR